MKYSKVNSQEEKFALVEMFINSKQTQVSWCKDNNVAISTLGRWLIQYKNKTKVDFAPVLPSRSKPDPSTEPDSKTTIVAQVGNCKFYIPKEIALPLLVKAMNEVQSDV